MVWKTPQGTFNFLFIISSNNWNVSVFKLQIKWWKWQQPLAEHQLYVPSFLSLWSGNFRTSQTGGNLTYLENNVYFKRDSGARISLSDSTWTLHNKNIVCQIDGRFAARPMFPHLGLEKWVAAACHVTLTQPDYHSTFNWSYITKRKHVLPYSGSFESLDKIQ